MQLFVVEMSPQASRDLDEIAAYIAAKSPSNARRFLAKLTEDIEGLCVLPRRNRVARESVFAGMRVRQLARGSYRVLYVVVGRVVRVVGVRHAART